MSLLLHYDNITQFKKEYHKNLLTTANIVDEEKYFKTLTDEDGEEYEFNEFCYVFKKDGKKYLFESSKRKELPIIVNTTEKFSYRGDAYYVVRGYNTARFKEEEKMSFKELINTLAGFEHTNPDGYKFVWMCTIAQLFERMNYRLSTAPGFGKDGVVDIVGNLVGGAATIENPTVAKLEYMTIMNLLAVNEVVDITPENWRQVQQFLLQTGAFKPEATKHSRAIAGVNETLDLTNFSLTLMYNDVDCYPSVEKYFDNTTTKQLKDRFVPFRIHGRLAEDFNAIKEVDVEKFVSENYQLYKDLISTFAYFKSNYMAKLKRYNTFKYDSKLSRLPERHKINVGKILKVIDLYCSTQSEFNYWVNLLLKYNSEYYVMLEYPKLREELESKKAKFGKESYNEFLKDLLSKETFSLRKSKINKFLADEYLPPKVKGESPIKDLGFWK